MVRIGSHISSLLILNTGVPQGCVLSPIPYSLFTHGCTAEHSSNTIIKFPDDATIMGLITHNRETAYREEVRSLTSWWNANNLSLSMSAKRRRWLCITERRRQGGSPPPFTSTMLRSRGSSDSDSSLWTSLRTSPRHFKQTNGRGGTKHHQTQSPSHPGHLPPAVSAEGTRHHQGPQPSSTQTVTQFPSGRR